MVLFRGSCLGPWPAAHQAPKALLFKSISSLIRNKRAEAEASAEPSPRSPEPASEISVFSPSRDGEEAAVASPVETSEREQAGRRRTEFGLRRSRRHTCDWWNKGGLDGSRLPAVPIACLSTSFPPSWVTRPGTKSVLTWLEPWEGLEGQKYKE